MESDQGHNANSEGRPEVPGPNGQPPRVDSLTPQRHQSRRRSRLALASLRLGLGSLLVCMLNWFVPLPLILSVGMAVAGGSLGIAAIRQIKRSGKHLGGLGSAIGGLVASCGTLLLVALIGHQRHPHDRFWLAKNNLVSDSPYLGLGSGD